MIFFRTLLFSCLLLAAKPGHATLISVDTSSLDPLATYYLWFTLTDGDDPTDVGNNTATITAFDIGGGLLGAPDDFNTGFTGDLSTTLTLTDGFFTSYGQAFNPGSLLSFDLALTGVVDLGDPDTFNFYVTNDQFLGVPTTALDGFGTLVFAEINSGTPLVQTFEITNLVVPEPSLTLLLVTGSVVILLRRRALRTARPA